MDIEMLVGVKQGVYNGLKLLGFHIFITFQKFIWIRTECGALMLTARLCAMLN